MRSASSSWATSPTTPRTLLTQLPEPQSLLWQVLIKIPYFPDRLRKGTYVMIHLSAMNMFKNSIVSCVATSTSRSPKTGKMVWRLVWSRTVAPNPKNSCPLDSSSSHIHCHQVPPLPRHSAFTIQNLATRNMYYELPWISEFKYDIITLW